MKRMWSKNEIKDMPKDITTLVDAKGHERFIEGDITFTDIEGITKTYGKWALSGSHLLIVIGATFEDELAINNGAILGYLNLPNWIINKIVPLFATTIVDRQSFALWADNYSSQSLIVYLTKPSSATLRIELANLTLTAKRNGRIAFDLLIDND